MQQKGKCSKLISVVCVVCFSGSYTTSVRRQICCPLNVAFQKMVHIEFLKCDTFVGATVSCQCCVFEIASICMCSLAFTKMTLEERHWHKNTNWTIGVYLLLLKAECLHSLTVFPALFFLLNHCVVLASVV